MHWLYDNEEHLPKFKMISLDELILTGIAPDFFVNCASYRPSSLVVIYDEPRDEVAKKIF